jgi:threonine dehydrogenase-like Zn-dependent dehydrogenase
VRALEYFPSVPRYLAARAGGARFPVYAWPLRLIDAPEPEVFDGWRRVRVRLCGICGSDISLLRGGSSPRLSPFFSFPAILGHEILGELDGSRVVVNPILGCQEKGLPECGPCSRGELPLCTSAGESGRLAPGMIGFCNRIPGGWAESTVAAERMLHEVPSGVPDERAVLAEPLAVALRGLSKLSRSLDAFKNALVIGAGPIGLLSVAALQAEGFAGKVSVVARHPIQRDLATALGASKVFASTQEGQEAAGSRSYPAIIGPNAFRGGYDLVVDAAGSATSLQEASWATTEGGVLLLLGAPGKVDLDFSPWWFGERTLIGSYTYSLQDFSKAVALLPQLHQLDLVEATFTLPDWRNAFRHVLARKAIKVAFRPES